MAQLRLLELLIFYAPTTLGTNGFILRSDGTNIVWGGDEDHITSAITSGTGNAVTAITADAGGVLSVVKGATFLTSFTETDPSIDTTVMGTAFTTPGTTGTAGKVYRVQKDAVGKAVVSVPWADTNTTYSAATSTALGLAKLASDTAQSIAPNAVSATAGKTYGIQNNASGQLVVNVPWVDTDTTYTGTAPIAVSGTVISHNDSGVSANTYGPGANATLKHGGTFTVPSVTVDAKGHLTGAATRTFTMPLDDSVATGTTTGTSNAYALAATGFVLTKGSHVVAKINVANSTTSTLNVNGTDAKTIQFKGAALTAGMLKVNTDYTFVYDGTNWQMLSDNDHITTSSTTGGGNAVTAITADANGALSVTKGQTFLTSADLPAAYVLPAATNTALGGLKLAQAADAAAATLATDTTTSTRNYRVKLDSGNIAYVNIPWLDHITTASTSGAGNAVTAITADANGALSITKGATFLTSFTETDPSIDTTVMGTAFTTPGTTGTAGKVYRVQKDAAGKAVVSVPWADTNTTYSAATSTVLGLAKLASDTAQAVAANAVTATAGKTYGIQKNGSGQMVVNVPWTDRNNRAFNGASTAGTAAAYTLAGTRPAFTASDLTDGSIVIATINVANSANPTLSVGGQTAKPIFMTDTDAAATAGALRAGTIYSFTFDGSNWYAKQIDTDTTYVAGTGINVTGNIISNALSYASDTTAANVGVLTNGSSTGGAMKTKTLTAGNNVTITGVSGKITIAATDTNTTYSAATSSVLGLAKLASDTAQAVAANAVTATASRTYGIQNNAAGQLVVNVPWVDTDTVYTHPASHVAAGTYGPGADATLTHNGTFTVPSVTVDAKGHLTGAATRTFTMPLDTDTNTAAKLSTTSTTALATSASESLLSGTVSLHKVAKTGTYSDLIGAPSIPAVPSACTAANTTCSLNYGQCLATENATGVACSGAQYYWELVVR